MKLNPFEYCVLLLLYVLVRKTFWPKTKWLSSDASIAVAEAKKLLKDQ